MPGQYRSATISLATDAVVSQANEFIARTVLGNFPFNPKVRLNYAETILPKKDGLPKLKDFPAAVGGSGETMPE